MPKLQIVQDWGGFEKFVAHIHDDGDVTVQHDQTLTGKSGATRQIDVLVKVKKGPYDYLTLIECKFWKGPVKREQIDVLWASMQDLNAAKGVFFTTKGFQKGAQKYAEQKGIMLYKVRELTDEEWGAPGKVVDLYLQIVQRTVRNFIPNIVGYATLNDAAIPAQASSVLFEVKLGDKIGSCNIISHHREKFATLEGLIEHYTLEAMNNYISNPLLINSGEECTRYLTQPMNFTLPENLVIEQKSILLQISSFSLDVGIKVLQSRMIIDRGSHLAYALAVVDCINKKIFSVTRSREQSNAVWTELSPENSKKTPETNKDIVVNGSIIGVSVEGFFDSHEMDSLMPMDLPTAPNAADTKHE